MNIEKMQVAIRPMNTSQAIDLGMAIARHWFLPLWLIWLGMASPVLLLIILFFLFDSSGLNAFEYFAMAVLFLAWFKPIYEKPLVLWVSRALFSETMPVITTIKQGWKMAKKDWWLLLIRHRISTTRQIMLPILVLEQPDKKAFKQRLSLILRGQSGDISLHSVLWSQIEFGFWFGVVILALEIESLDIEGYLWIEQLLYLLPNNITDIMFFIIIFLAMSLVAPFFIAGGFAIYITKRCLLEGWDIELTFKQLNQRFLQSKVSILDRPLKKQ